MFIKEVYTITVFSAELHRVNEDERDRLNNSEEYRMHKIAHCPCNSDFSDYTLTFDSKSDAMAKYNELLNSLHSSYIWGNRFYIIRWIMLDIFQEDTDENSEYIDTLQFNIVPES